eukprot:gene6169-6407_t
MTGSSLDLLNLLLDNENPVDHGNATTAQPAGFLPGEQIGSDPGIAHQKIVGRTSRGRAVKKSRRQGTPHAQARYWQEDQGEQQRHAHSGERSGKSNASQRSQGANDGKRAQQHAAGGHKGGGKGGGKGGSKGGSKLDKAAKVDEEETSDSLDGLVGGLCTADDDMILSQDVGDDTSEDEYEDDADDDGHQHED